MQLAIEITTNSQEAAAKHEAERLEQEAKGRLERQRINDQAEAERSRKQLLELQVENGLEGFTEQSTFPGSFRCGRIDWSGEGRGTVSRAGGENRGRSRRGSGTPQIAGSWH